MARAKSVYELRSLSTALGTYLQTAGWNVTMREGFFSNEAVEPDTVAVHFTDNRIAELQMGRGAQEKGLVRVAYINAYMSNEFKARDIVDEIMEFVDMVPITVSGADSSPLGSMICYNTASITGNVVPPIMKNPSIIRWRGVVSATYETYYLDD